MPITYTIELNDEKELAELEKIAKEHGWNLLPPIVSKYKQADISDEDLHKLHELMDNGVDTSNYGEPVEWQREQRKNRKLPFRN